MMMTINRLMTMKGWISNYDDMTTTMITEAMMMLMLMLMMMMMMMTMMLMTDTIASFIN